MTVTSWDDYPVHQSANWIAHVATSDRNFYDRYYFNAFDTGGEFMAVFGLGQYRALRRAAARRAGVAPPL
jgi:hypothetical protein